MLKRILQLALNRATLKQYYLEIGAYFLKKGCNVEIGQVLKIKEYKPGVQQVKVVTEMYYSFHDNKITHRTGTRVLRK